MKHKNAWAFSIVLAMILVIIMLLVAYNLLDFLIPFSKNTKGIENASNAYYQSYWRVEQSINFVAKNPVWSSTWMNMTWSAIWSSIVMDSSGTIIPKDWKWNSEFDKNWNRIGPGEPLQLYIKSAQNWRNFKFRVPDLNKDWTYNWVSEALSWWILPIINWQISGSWFTLNSSWSQIKANQIWNISSTWTSGNINIFSNQWLDLNWSSYTLGNFYSTILNNCSSNPCSLKLSIINTLTTQNNTNIPYLEYKITFQNPIPQQYVDIITEGKSYWFKKTINTKYRVDTTSEAFDFTVFQ